MDLFVSATLLYLATLTLSTVSSQRCTTATLDPRNVSSYDPGRLVPLYGRDTERFYSFSVQWIFPTLRFTCYGLLRRWIFTGVPGQAAASCRVELETWRLDTSGVTSSMLYYERISTTERNRVTVTQDGANFIYELAAPVLVEPGDVVGVEVERLCIVSEDFDNILSFNVSGTGSTFTSFRQDGPDSYFYVDPLYAERDFVPLIEAVVEPFPDYTGSIVNDIRTPSATELEGATTGADSDQSVETSIVTIAAAIVGCVTGVIITVIVCVCMWCIIRHVSCKKERQQPKASKQQQEEQLQPQNGTMSMQQNDAYTEPTVYHRVIGIPERAVQLNRVYGLQRGGCVDTDREEDYERMYAATADSHVMFGRNARKVEKCLHFAKPREYEPPAQQRGGNTYIEDSEHPYEYI